MGHKSICQLPIKYLLTKLHGYYRLDHPNIKQGNNLVTGVLTQLCGAGHGEGWSLTVRRCG